MTVDHRTPEDIEREIERDRARLTDRLGSLQEQISLDGALQQVGDQLREHGGALGQSLSRTVRDNPAAVALTGIGVAWLIFGGKSSDSDGDKDRRVPEPVAAMPAGPAQTDPRLPDWAAGDDVSDDDADSPGMRDRLADAQDRASEAVGTARDRAAARADAVRDRLSRGTEELSDQARRRVVAARETAIKARRAAARRMPDTGKAKEQASAFYERQPLVAGALAVALGAAIGSALPRTSREDKAMGKHSDGLISEAERIFQEELAKAREVAGAAVDEAKSIAREKKDEMDAAAPGDTDAAQAVGDEARHASKRVAKAASKKAKDNKLGTAAS